MKKFIIVSFIEKFPLQFSASAWPLHVTIVRPFESEDKKILTNILEKACSGEQRITTVGVGEALFGVDKNIPVVELKKVQDLEVLHQKISKAIFHITSPVSPIFDSFRPHVTKQHHNKINVEDNVVIQSISLVEMIGEERVVLSTYHLMP